MEALECLHMEIVHTSDDAVVAVLVGLHECDYLSVKRLDQECAFEADIPLVPTVMQSLRVLIVSLLDETQSFFLRQLRENDV